MTAQPSCVERPRTARAGGGAVPPGAPAPGDGRPLTAVLVVSHSSRLAEGVVEIAAQMTPQVLVRGVGGGADGGVGTDPAAVEAAVRDLLAAGHQVLVTTDLGSALMVAEMAVETVLGEQGAGGPVPVLVVDVPVTRGTLAAAVEAASGADAGACARAARAVISTWDDGARPDPDALLPARHEEPVASRPLRLGDPAGLHARPAARLAVLLEEERSRLWVGGRPATTMSQLLLLGVTRAGWVEATVVGPDPGTTLDRVQRLLAGDEGAGRVPGPLPGRGQTAPPHRRHIPDSVRRRPPPAPAGEP